MDTSRSPLTRTLRHLLLALAAVVALPLVLVTPAAQAHPAGAEPEPFCGITWGSLPKRGSDYPPPGPPYPGIGGIDDVRTGRHECFDRLVIDIDEPGTWWNVEYVDEVREGGSGTVVPTSGGARLQVSVMAQVFRVVDPVTGDIEVLYRPADRLEVVDVAGYDTFRDVTYGWGFEGQHEFGLGVRARLPFRVFHLDGPGDGSRLVVDVAHRWS